MFLLNNRINNVITILMIIIYLNFLNIYHNVFITFGISIAFRRWTFLYYRTKTRFLNNINYKLIKYKLYQFVFQYEMFSIVQWFLLIFIRLSQYNIKFKINFYV